MTIDQIQDTIAEMTLEEKASLCSGMDFWHTQEIPRLGIPSSLLSDGPHGLRKQNQNGDHLGIGESILAVCFPAGCCAASSFDSQMLQELGEVIGAECQAEGISMILGPAVNIKRTPLCGRNFEYYSEDPILASGLASAFIKGVQSKGVGACVKHFLANNQENGRMSYSSEIDERTLREIYLRAFEEAVTEGKPWSVMCAYNKINGIYAAENRKYLTGVLRQEWGFDGYVVSDWGAVNDRVKDLEAGLDLEMPPSKGCTDKKIVEAVQEGDLSEEVVNQAVERILRMVYRWADGRTGGQSWDRIQDHEKARILAEESMVLLKNEDVLPLKLGEEIAFIGCYAKKPRYQGGGSSHINSFRVTSALDCIPRESNISYAIGFDEDSSTEEMEREALCIAAKVEKVVVFAGLPEAWESEGYDRTHMKLPACQNSLIEKIAAIQPNTIVVLHNGAPVEMPWVSRVKGILEAYLGGEAVGAAVTNILFGKVNPSGRLPETFPIRLEDSPAHLNYRGEYGKLEYREGIFVGYRYFDIKQMEVLFPFGHGLSYTTFDYRNLTVSKMSMTAKEEVKVSVEITNTGLISGKEVIELYISDSVSSVSRPVRELKRFCKVYLEPGETKQVSFSLGLRDFAYWSEELHGWKVETGEFSIQIGRSSREVILKQSVWVEGIQKTKRAIDLNSTFDEIMMIEGALDLLLPYAKGGIFDKQRKKMGEEHQAVYAGLRDKPLRTLLCFGESDITLCELEEIIEKINRIC